MSGNRGVAGAAAMLMTGVLLSGCTENVREKCSGSGDEQSCTVTYSTSDGQWSTELEGMSSSDTEATFSGTFTIESGSGTLLIEGGDYGHEYTLSPDEPVTIEDLSLLLKEDDGETWIYVEVTADPQIDGFSAEYTLTTR